MEYFKSALGAALAALAFVNDIVPVIIFVAVLVLVGWGRWRLGSVIGKAAIRRGRSNDHSGWAICSLLIGPLPVWLFCLIFIHWRPAPAPMIHYDDALLTMEQQQHAQPPQIGDEVAQ